MCASPVYAGHPGVDIDARRATPGLRLELREIAPTVQSAKRYRLHLVGYPRGVIFNVFTKNFTHSFEEAASGFQVDRSGNLVSSKLVWSQRLDEIAFEPGPYPRGAVWEVALVSADRELSAFGKVIPHPIAASDGPCILSLELVSQRGERFLASGVGFMAGDEVSAESHYAGRVFQQRRRISPEGFLPPQLVSHAASGADRKARYTVKGRSCQVAIDYEWGEPALIRR